MAITASTTILPRADGSAAFKFGPTSAIASVAGPMEVKPLYELEDRAYIEVVARPAVGVGGMHIFPPFSSLPSPLPSFRPLISCC